MAWIAVDKDGGEIISEYKPYVENKNTPVWQVHSGFANVPKGTAEKLTGKPMVWGDEPRKLE